MNEKEVFLIKISVIIPIYNGAKFLDDAFKGLEHQTIDPKSFEVIAIDDGSTDTSYDFLMKYAKNSPKFTFQFDRQKNSGVSHTRNVGASRATGEFLAFLDQDAIPRPNWLESALECFRDSRTSVVEGRIQAIKIFEATPLTHILENETGGRFMTANCIFRASVFREVGGFDLNFPYFLEDSDIAFSILRLGHKIHWAPEVVVDHPYVQKTMSQHVWQMTTLAERIPILLHKHQVDFKFCRTHGIPWHTMTACPLYFYGYFVALVGIVISGLTLNLVSPVLSYSLLFLFACLYGVSFLVTLYARFRHRKVSLSEGSLFFLWYLIIPYKRLFHLIRGAYKYKVPLRLI